MSTSANFDAESYLKSGSNELRILEYRTTGMSFGINILKVSKIISNVSDFTQMPESHPAVRGLIRDMGRLIPVVDLAAFLGVTNESTRLEKIVVTEFFGMLTGFWVDRIDWIHHFKWEDVIDAQNVFKNINQRYVIGIVKPTEKRMVLLLDYETMLLDLNPNLSVTKDTGFRAEVHLSGKLVLVAEDSAAVRAMLTNELTEVGCKVVEASDGLIAWNHFQKQEFDLVISDVEMPQMDGLALTLNIRQSERGKVPVIVYSSIGDVGMKARAKFLKADAHVTKLNIPKLMDTASRLLSGESIESDDSDTASSVEPEFDTLVAID